MICFQTNWISIKILEVAIFCLVFDIERHFIIKILNICFVIMKFQSLFILCLVRNQTVASEIYAVIIIQ